MYDPNVYDTVTPTAGSFFKRLSALLLLLVALLFSFPDTRHAIINKLAYFIYYSDLIHSQPPTDNSLPNPLVDAHLTDTWGAPRSNGRKHEGIDIFAKRGTPIHATTEGMVTRVGVDKLGGNIVMILGPGRVSHYYAHLEGFANIRKGDWVKAGDVIGYVGNSGNAKTTPPHLHYGVYTESGAVNPYPLLQK